jgi:hypothetical protein
LGWQDNCGKYGGDFWTAIAYARNCMLRRLPPHHQAQVLGLIGLLEEIQKPLTPPILWRLKLHPQAPLDELFNYQKHCVQVGMWVVAELAVYDSDIEVLKDFSRRAFGPGPHWTYRIGGKSISVEKLPVLSRALVENHLHGWTDWRTADDPQAWVARVARDIAQQQAWEERFLRGERVERERILEERYACRAMADWTARGPEYKVRNQPVELPRFGVRAGMVRKVKYVRRAARHRDVRL